MRELKIRRHYINPLKIRGNIHDAIIELRRAMAVSAKNKCELCGSQVEVGHIHHINNCPLDWRIENLIFICPACHSLQRRISPDMKRFANRLSLGYDKMAECRMTEVSHKVLRVAVNSPEPKNEIKIRKKIKIRKDYKKPSRQEIDLLKREGILA